MSPQVRLRSHAEINPEAGCWEWAGGRNQSGYGRLCVGSRRDGTRQTMQAHRYSYSIFVGPIPPGLWVLHKCDNPPCINPDHLFLGDRMDNTRDRDAKGRQPILRGVANGNAKLNDDAVAAMRSLRREGASFATIARRFGVAKKTCMEAIKGHRWRHVTELLPEPPEGTS